MDDLIIKKAKKTDSEKIAALSIQVWLDNYAKDGIRDSIAEFIFQEFKPASIKRLIESNNITILMLLNGPNLIGFVQVRHDYRNEHLKSDNQAEIASFYLQEPFCNRGLGKQLLEAAYLEAQGLGVEEVWLKVYIYNERAIKFYKKNGFIDVGAWYMEIDGKNHENRVLKRILI